MEKEILDRLLEIERQLQEVESGNAPAIKDIRKSIDALKELTHELKLSDSTNKSELSSSLVSVDRDVAIQNEKINSVLNTIKSLDVRIMDLEGNTIKSQDTMRSFLEKILMAIIGGILTYLFSLLNGG